MHVNSTFFFEWLIVFLPALGVRIVVAEQTPVDINHKRVRGSHFDVLV